MREENDGPAIAHQRIAQEASERTGVLDLGRLGLTELPEDLFRLKHLRQLRIARERAGRAASLECSLAELDALEATVARATDGWSRDRRVALALRVQKEARQAGHSRGRAAYLFLLDRYQRLGQTPAVSEPARPEPPRQLSLALSDDPSSTQLSRRPPPADEAMPDQPLTRSGGVGEETLWKIGQKKWSDMDGRAYAALASSVRFSPASTGKPRPNAPAIPPRSSPPCCPRLRTRPAASCTVPLSRPAAVP